jgi:hypothetical protein
MLRFLRLKQDNNSFAEYGAMDVMTGNEAEIRRPTASALKMKAAGYSETSTRRHIPEDMILHTDCHENVEFKISQMFTHFLHIYNQANYMQDLM